MILYLLVALGGALGSVLRYFLNGVVAQWTGPAFPWGTILINISGSFMIGFFAALTGPQGRVVVSQGGRLFFMVGICGGYTTFSAFSFQTLTLANDEEWLLAGANVVISVIACLAAVWLGHTAAMWINLRKVA